MFELKVFSRRGFSLRADFRPTGRQLLGLSTATVYRLCERGDLHHVRFSNLIRVAPTHVKDFLERMTR